MRKRKGKLSNLQVSKRVLGRYRNAVALLLAFWSANACGPTQGVSFDTAVSSYIEAQWEEGDPVYQCDDALAGLQFYLPLKGKLVASWKLLKTWHKMEPSLRVLPMHPLLLMGMASLIWKLGHHDVASLCLVGFDCFLRSGELYMLERRDILFEKDKCVLKLRHTKTGSRTGFDEMVICHSPLATKLLKKACSRLQPNQKVLRSSPYIFRKLFNSAAEVFGFSDRISVYSLRRGGATWSFLQSGSMELVLLRGRWQSTTTARIYLQDATAGLSDLQLSDKLRDRLRQHAIFLKKVT